MKRLILALGLTAFVAVGVGAVENDTDGISTFPSNPPTEGSWPILATIDLEAQSGGDNRCVGVGYDGNFWVSAGDGYTGQCTFYMYDEYGNLLDQAPQGAGATGWGNRDLATDGEYMFGSYSNLVNGYGPDMGFAGYYVGCLNPNRALAYDGGCFWTSGFSEYLYRMTWDGAFGSTATCEIMNITAFSAAYGLAYDGNDECLYMTFTGGATVPGEVKQFAMTGAEIGSFTTLPEYDTHGGCTMACTAQFGDILCILMQDTPDTLVFYDLGHGPSAVNDGSWGSIKAMYR
jgi:hypothetical protein